MFRKRYTPYSFERQSIEVVVVLLVELDTNRDPRVNGKIIVVKYRMYTSTVRVAHG